MLITRELNGRQWTYSSPESSEAEAQEFLYGLVRLVKPSVAIETGCHHGDASFAIGLALHHNKIGVLHTCDTNPECISRTQKETRWLPVTVHEKKAVEMLAEIKDVDFAFIDGGAMRISELKAVNVLPGAYVVLHDANNPLYFEPAMRLGWTAIRFHTPLGLALFEVK